MKIQRLALFLVLALIGTAAALAGGFWISIHSGASPLGAQTPDAAVLVEVNGCANPADAKLSGTAEGTVKGRRQSVPLAFIPTSKPGVYAVKKQWSSDGVWVLVIHGVAHGQPSNALVEVGPNGQYRAERAHPKKIEASRIEAALARAASRSNPT